jgi:hypothetical protein
VIVAVCADKGGPGVTTLSTALALAWPGERILLEADPSGGDMALRMRLSGTEFLAREPTMLTLATAVRSGAHGSGLSRYAQITDWGIPVIPGPPMAEAWTPMLHLWALVAEVIQDWAGTVIVDLGCLQPGHPGFCLAEAADVVLLVTTASLEGLFRGRERALELTRLLATSTRPQPVGVVVRSSGRDQNSTSDVHRVLMHLAPVVGGFADDPTGVRALRAGPGSAGLGETPLLRSAKELISRIQRTRPESPRASERGTAPPSPSTTSATPSKRTRLRSLREAP